MPLRILLADDSMTAQNMGKKILTDAGYEVVAVSNGAAAVKKIAEISPHLCILDIYMPGYTGLEVCEKIKASSVTARMPVLLTVGKMEPYKPEEGARVRADGVIVKPFEASELLRAVHRFSQRIAGVQPRAATPTPTSSTVPPPASSGGTYERTVKLTREQIQEYMDPGFQGWKGVTAGPDSVSAPAARTDFPVEMARTSTADAMPSFAGHGALADAETPAAVAEVDLSAVAVATTVEELPLEPGLQTVEATIEPSVRSAATVLPGFVDYLIAQSNMPEATTSASEDPVEVTAVAAQASVDTLAVTEAAAPEAVFAVNAPVEPVDTLEPQEISVDRATESATKESSEGLNGVNDALQIGYEIPPVDPALEVVPEVAVTVTPDPQFESAQDLVVENATEEGLQPTSRAVESEGVVTTADPNLAPMVGLTDAMQPLEGERLAVEVPDQAVAMETVVESSSLEAPAASVEADTTEAPEAPTSQAPSVIPTVGTGKKSKKSKDMRPIPAFPPTAAATAELGDAAARGNDTQEISAVLDLLGQTTAAFRKVVPGNGEAVASAAMEEAPATPVPGARIWMAEEVALSESEATLSLENEMRVAYAATAVAPEVFAAAIPAVAEEAFRSGMAAIAPAEVTVRDDKNAPQPAVPDPGGSPPGSGALPTQELAAAMAAAFGGALPQEDLARAEETQSISEEVRRFALGDAYKPKPSFGGAAVEDPVEKRVSREKLSAAIGRALDRLKPQLVAEILKELEVKEEKN